MSRCRRTTCESTATERVRVVFWSGRVVVDELCAVHGQRLYDALLAKPQTRSGSRTPLPVAGVVGVLPEVA